MMVTGVFLPSFLSYVRQVRGELSLLSVLRDPMLQSSFGRWLEQSSGKNLLQVKGHGLLIIYALAPYQRCPVPPKFSFRTWQRFSECYARRSGNPVTVQRTHEIEVFQEPTPGEKTLFCHNKRNRAINQMCVVFPQVFSSFCTDFLKETWRQPPTPT